MMPLTHELLSTYLGTSREIATQFLIQFRSEGYVRYSRREIVVYVDALKEWLKQESGKKAETAAASAKSYTGAAAA